MREYWDFIVQTATVAKMLDTIRSIMSKKLAIITGATAIIVTVAIAAFLIGRNAVPAAEPAPTAHAPTSAPTGTPLGGLDLAGYCRSSGYETNSETFCLSKIDLDKACDWAYKRTGLSIRLTAGDPYSGICYEPTKNEDLGGISDMAGFCKSGSEGEPKPAVMNGEWFCQELINMNVACIAQYLEENVEARRDSNGVWICHRKGPT